MQVTLCSPKQLLQIILQDAFLCQENFFGKSFFGLHPTPVYLLKSRLQHSESWLKPIQKKAQLVYRSAVPHQIGSDVNMSAAKVATTLAAKLAIHVSDHTSFQIPADLSPTLLAHIDIQATSSGYLEFRLDDWAIAQWLNCLTQPTTPLFDFAKLYACPAQPSLPSLFSIQHAHARCCSLLRLAAQRQIIGLNWQKQAAQWQWTQTNSISWLTPEQKLRVNHASERQLINQCLTVLDKLPWQGITLPENIQPPLLNSSRITALAQDLAQAFSTMHQHCQIWGALETEGRDRQTVHLAMILVTQRLLCGLLTGLGVIAPEAL